MRTGVRSIQHCTALFHARPKEPRSLFTIFLEFCSVEILCEPASVQHEKQAGGFCARAIHVPPVCVRLRGRSAGGTGLRVAARNPACFPTIILSHTRAIWFLFSMHLCRTDTRSGGGRTRLVAPISVPDLVSVFHPTAPYGHEIRRRVHATRGTNFCAGPHVPTIQIVVGI